MKAQCSLFILILLPILAMSQSYSAMVVDDTSGKPIPYATVITGAHSGVITNEEGIFSLTPRMAASVVDSLEISSMGYQNKRIAMDDFPEEIRLVQKTFELESVYIDGKGLSADEIVELVKLNLDKNYKMELSKKKIFFRQSDFNNMDKVDFGFKKSTIPELNEALINSIAAKIPRNSSYYKEVAGEFYGDYSRHKLYIDKAAELYDKNKDVSVDGLSEKLEKIFQDNVKPDSYIKIRSGIFSTKMQLDSAMAAEESEPKNVQVEVKDESDNYIQNNIKDKISELYSELFFQEDTKLDFLEKSNRYRFQLEDYTFIDNNPMYIIGFTPKGKKDFQGVMYVSTDDYAIVRLEFENVRPLKRFGLLGITYRHATFKGKMLFGKNSGGTYSPRYIELTDGRQMGLDRPLNVIEKNKNVKGRRKQNELALHLDMRVITTQKSELVIFESEDISSSDYENAKENSKVKATYMSQYDPEFWKGYTIMEPNKAIQAFKVVEN